MSAAILLTAALCGYAAPDRPDGGIHDAVRQNDLGRVRLILALNPSAASAQERLYTKSPGVTPLHVAAYRDHIAAMKLLVAAGADVNTTGGRLYTPLQEAVEAGAVRAVEFLLTNGAELDIFSAAGLGRVAEVEAGLKATARLGLGKRTANMAFPNHWGEVKPILNWAIAGGDKDTVLVLLRYGAEVNPVRRLSGWTVWSPLHAAVVYDRIELAELLLARGGRLEDKDGDGQTALHLAVRYEKTRMVALLLDRGAKVNTRADIHAPRVSDTSFDPYGMDTPLHTAARSGSVGNVTLLLARGADVSALNEEGRTPVDLAEEEARAVPANPDPNFGYRGRPASEKHDTCAKLIYRYGGVRGPEQETGRILPGKPVTR